MGTSSFVEADLLKATNVYQQFDRKGNLFENRLYAKTSINQAKLNREAAVYERMMESQPDEFVRINNGSQTSHSKVDDEMYQTVATGKSQLAMNQNVFSGTATDMGRSQQSASVGNFNKSAATNMRGSPSTMGKSRRNGRFGTTVGTAMS